MIPRCAHALSRPCCSAHSLDPIALDCCGAADARERQRLLRVRVPTSFAPHHHRWPSHSRSSGESRQVQGHGPRCLTVTLDAESASKGTQDFTRSQSSPHHRSPSEPAARAPPLALPSPPIMLALVLTAHQARCITLSLRASFPAFTRAFMTGLLLGSNSKVCEASRASRQEHLHDGVHGVFFWTHQQITGAAVGPSQTSAVDRSIQPIIRRTRLWCIGAEADHAHGAVKAAAVWLACSLAQAPAESPPILLAAVLRLALPSRRPTWSHSKVSNHELMQPSRFGRNHLCDSSAPPNALPSVLALARFSLSFESPPPEWSLHFP